jgi:molybdopterin-guanine dinucleotide biosynthesis protein A
MPAQQQPIGVLLAGGRGARMGGPKLGVALRGKPLMSYPLQALCAALTDVAVIGKPDVELPSLSGVAVWIEPQEPQHPLVGVVEGLALAGGRSVLVCAADLPFITAEVISRLAAAPAHGAPAVIAKGVDSGPQPLLGRYEPAAAELLAPAAREARAPVREAVAAIGPGLLEVDEQVLFNVNSPDDLLLAAALLDSHGPAR